MTPGAGLRRVLRVAALGGSSALLGSGAHLLGGGSLPGPGVTVVLAALLGLVAVSATHRRLHVGALLALLSAEQLGLHAVLAVAGHVPAVSGGSHLSHAVTVGPINGADPMSASPLMLAAHVAATVLTAVLLARGEQWLWRFADDLSAATAGPKRRRPRARATTGQRPPTPVTVLRLPYEALRRGPPSVVA